MKIKTLALSWFMKDFLTARSYGLAEREKVRAFRP